jgi:TaqI-like C-terminal specificity domain
MLPHDFDLQSSQIQTLSTRDAIVAFFATLGYDTDARLTQTPSAMGFPEALAHEITHIERIADHDAGALQVYLLKMKHVTVALTQALARALRTRAGSFLLVLTADYERIDFVLLELTPPKAAASGLSGPQASLRPRVLTVERRNPSVVAQRVLRRFSYTEADAYYQWDKLLSAYSIAEWSEPFFNNRALFSDYYLNERLRETPEWSENPAAALRTFQGIFADVRARVSRKSEAIARTEVHEPALRALGFTLKANKQKAGDAIQPHYVLFAAADATKPLAYCNVYAWDRNLDGRDETRDTVTPDENPGALVVSLLEQADAPGWVIVTNGKTWRLYAARSHSRATNYYELDLEETIASPDPGFAFRYFWLMFRAAAFVEADSRVLESDSTAKARRRKEKTEEKTAETATVGKSFLERLLDESALYAKRLGERLKDRVFEGIFPEFAEGFIAHIRASEGARAELGAERLEGVFHGTLTFLYRLLFLLYAEARDLLPVREVRGYQQVSLTQLKSEIQEKAGTILDNAPEKIEKAYSASSTELYERLEKLFAIIDQGEATLNVPLYNGGLFITKPAADDRTPEADNARFLNVHKIPDRYLALGLDRMARDLDDKTKALAPIDYKSLGVRQLGSIYEGLLEFKLRVASQRMAVVKGKKTDEVVPASQAEADGLRVKEHIPKGKPYLENDKRERKATGSYYTPDYIVKYIVAHTVGPVLDEKCEALRPRLRDAQKQYRDALARVKGFQKQGMKPTDPDASTYLATRAVVDALFDVRVLDPAMGSGHFLVEAVDFITDRMLDFLNAFPWNPVTAELRQTRQAILAAMEGQQVTIDEARLTDVNLLKRHILKRCIYGVDLNPMAVELAKVSLWLDCFTLGAPLSFLDHHLKCGNSLIGARVREVQDAVEMVRNVTKSKAVADSQTFKKVEKTTLQFQMFGSLWTGAMLATDLMRHVGELSDVTAEQVKLSRSEFRKANDALAPFRRILDVYVSRWFGNEPTTGEIRQGLEPTIEFLRDQRAGDWAKSPNEVVRALKSKMLKVTATTLKSAADKRFFHWELEFPEVFFGPAEGTTQAIRLKENGGFDAVVGNPPWASVRGKHASGLFDESDVSYTNTRFPENTYMPNAYEFFVATALQLISTKGRHSFIVPDRLGFNASLEYLRERFLNQFSLISLEYKMPFPEVIVDTLVYVVTEQSNGSNHKIKVTDYNNETVFVPPSFYKEVGDKAFVFFANRMIFDTLQKIDGAHVVPLGAIAQTTSGFGGKSSEITEKRLHSRQIPAIKGADIGHYVVLGHHYFLFVDENLTGRTRDKVKLSYKPKVLLRKTGDLLYAAYDDTGAYPEQSAYFLFEYAKQFSPYFLLALLNSGVFRFYYMNKLVTNRDSTPQLKKIHLDVFPIRRISFTTSRTRHAALVKEGNNLYVPYLREHAPQTILEFVTQRLSAQPEESDVIHDLLAYLAEQMIELNKQKQAELKRFLDWLESALHIGADDGLDALTGKSRIRNYLGDYQKEEAELSFEELSDILYKNRTKLSVSLSEPRLTSRLHTEYDNSLEVLRPIKEKLALTDRLIDQIVYRLYGLTEEEVAVVEGKKWTVIQS